MRPVHRTAALVATLVAVVGLAYVGSINGGFVSDDLQMVQPNPLLRSLEWSNIKRIFTTFDDANYVPLKVLSLAVDQAVWGPEPLGYHVTNVALHIGSAVLIFSTLLFMGMSRGASFFVALLWAIHPLQVESVAWISERKNVLSGFFFFAAFRAYVSFSERPRPVTYALVLVLYVVALLSKMNTLVLPAVCLAYEATYRWRTRWRDVGTTLPMFALGALVAWYNLAGSQSHGEGFHGGSAAVTWMSSAVVVFRYLSLAVLPVGLNSRYDVTLFGSPFDAPVAGAILGITALIMVTVWLVRQRNRAAFWLLWFAITLSPMLNIIPFRSMMQDRYMYLALLGPLAILGLAADRLGRARAKRVALGLAVVASFSCLIATANQIEHWSSPVTLWVRDAHVRALRADEAILRPDSFEAKLRAMQAAVRSEPTNATLQNNLGALYFESGDITEASAHFETANRLAPDEPMVQINLGRAYDRLRRYDDAETVLRRASVLLPYDFTACYYLLRHYLLVEDVSNARTTYNRCVALYKELPGEETQLKVLESAAR